MGRKVMRVPLDFDHPLKERWPGYLMPDSYDGIPCKDCDESGYSPRAEELRGLWYGNLPFRPEWNGSTPLTQDTPAVRAFAERNIAHSPGFYGTGEQAICREAQRLAVLWNGRWCHHLNADDVAALVSDGRLWDFTHTWVRGTGWIPRDPPVIPTPETVNTWSLRGFGHGSINAHAVVSARCAREGVNDTCLSCQGHGSVEAYPGQRDEAENWTRTEPPEGPGWQLWETVTEGSPISPVFDSAEHLARWLATPEGAEANNQQGDPMPLSQALAFVLEGQAFTMYGNAGGIHEGTEFVGSQAVINQIMGATGE